MIHNISRRTKNVIMGFVLIGIGIGYLGTEMELWEFTLFFSGWWTMFLIIPSLLGMLEYGISFPNVCSLLFGGYFLAQANQWIDFTMTFPIFMAVICIGIGVRLLCTRRTTWYGYKAD